MNIKWVEWTTLWMPSVLLINITEMLLYSWEFFAANARGGADREKGPHRVTTRRVCVCVFSNPAVYSALPCVQFLYRCQFFKTVCDIKRSCREIKSGSWKWQRAWPPSLARLHVLLLSGVNSPVRWTTRCTVYGCLSSSRGQCIPDFSGLESGWSRSDVTIGNAERRKLSR